MRSAKRAVCALSVLVLVCMMLSATAFADESGKVWLKVDQSEDSNAATLIVTDTTVTDGVVTLTYDSDELTYQSVEVNEDRVAMYAVNAETLGEVRISWVAPEAYEADGSALALIQVNFAGKADEDSVELSGSAFDAEGNEIPVGSNQESEGESGSDETTDASDATEGDSDEGGNGSNADTGDDFLVTVAMGAAILCLAGMGAMVAAVKKEGTR